MKNYNALDMKGRLFNYSLEADTNDKGDVVKGEVELEVDENGTVVKVRFYVNEKTNAGKVNKTYGILYDMLQGEYKTVVEHGEDASWLALTGNIDVSYFMGRDGNLVVSQKLRGGFINANGKHEYSNKWKLDMLVTGVKEFEADEEKQLERFVKVTGYLIDDYRDRVMEVAFQARSEKAMTYLLTQIDPSEEHPHFVSVGGSIVRMSRLVVRKNAFGEDETDEYDSFQWVLSRMAPDAYDFGDEAAITQEKYDEFRKNLEAHKAEQENKSEGDGDNASGGKQELAF